jgi:phage baseplate assembly protein W
MAKGLGILLPIERGNTGYFRQGFDPLEQIKTNLVNLLKTRMGERLHQPEFGCKIHDLLFEPLTDENMETAKQSVVDAVRMFFPFLRLVDIQIVEKETNKDKNTFDLYVKYEFVNNPNVGDSIILNF